MENSLKNARKSNQTFNIYFQRYIANWLLSWNLENIENHKDSKTWQGDVTKVNSYRPISLLPIISKLFEKVLLEQLKPKFCSAAFLDIAQAFDKVWHEGLLYKIRTLLPNCFYEVIKILYG